MEIQAELYQKSQNELIKLLKKEYQIELVNFSTEPKLFEIGRIVIDSLWNNQDIIAQYYIDIQQYHFVVACLCFEAGVSAASLWKENNACFDDVALLEMIKKPSPYFARSVVQKILGINDFQVQLLYSRLYDKYIRLNKTFLGKEKAEDMMKTVLFALNQLGASIVI